MTPTPSGATTINMVALREQYEQLKPRIDAAIAAVIDRSAFIAGPAVAEFERGVADYCGVAPAVGVSSGPTAIEPALRALGIGAGDGVLITADTFVAGPSAVRAPRAT